MNIVGETGRKGISWGPTCGATFARLLFKRREPGAAAGERACFNSCGTEATRSDRGTGRAGAGVGSGSCSVEIEQGDSCGGRDVWRALQMFEASLWSIVSRSCSRIATAGSTMVSCGLVRVWPVWMAPISLILLLEIVRARRAGFERRTKAGAVYDTKGHVLIYFSSAEYVSHRNNG